MSIRPILEIVEKLRRTPLLNFLKLLFTKSAGFEVCISTDKQPDIFKGDWLGLMMALNRSLLSFMLVLILYNGKYFNVTLFITRTHTHTYINVFLWFTSSSFHRVILIPIAVNWNRLLAVYEAWPSVYSVIWNSD